MKRYSLIALAVSALVVPAAFAFAADSSASGGTAGADAADTTIGNVPTQQAITNVLMGADAFGGWQDNEPGVWRQISPGDLPNPFATKSASNAPALVARPANAMPKVPAGFKVELVKSGLQGPRVIRRAPNGDLFVADSAANQIVVLRMKDGSAKPIADSVFASKGLDRPYGIAFYPLNNPRWVYVGNAGSVVRFPYRSGDLKASGPAETVVANVPSGGHWTRDIVFSPDGTTLYLTVGSGSNIAGEVKGPPPGGLDQWAQNEPLGEMWGAEKGRGTVLAFNPDGTNRRVYATGLRNCSGLAIEPTTGNPWCVVNERDGLGDNVPPDFATLVQQGHFYGWPWFYIGYNEDPRAPLKGQRADLADQVTLPDVLFQAHSAPLGITFYDGKSFPATYWGDAFVTMHGSWNRGTRTGYKIVRLKFENGLPTGAYEDFMTGFGVSADQVWGRPVGVAVAKDGSLIVGEDGSGTIWRVSYDAPS